MPTTVVLTHGGGRFGNQLLLFAHLIALAEREPDIEVIDVPFWSYAEWCDGTVANRLCLYPPRHDRHRLLGALATVTRTAALVLPRRLQRSFAFRLPRLVHRLTKTRSIDLDYAPTTDITTPAFLARLRSAPWIVLAGYDLRAWDALDAHADRVRAFLRPIERFWTASDAFLRPLRRQHDRLVGLHIRRGDYRIWEEGKFFFDDDRYRVWIAQMRQRWGSGTGFVLTSDEIFNRSTFDPEFCHWSEGTAGGSGHYLESMTALAQCDIVCGVPSTFVAWAAFFGAKPLLPLAADVDAGSEPCIDRIWSEGRQHRWMRYAIR